jgi:hypothetical protein
MKEEKFRASENWFEIAYNNSIWQTQEASWDEVYRALEENRTKSHSILIRVNEESFAKPDLTLALLEASSAGSHEMRFRLFDDEPVYSTEITAIVFHFPPRNRKTSTLLNIRKNNTNINQLLTTEN